MRFIVGTKNPSKLFSVRGAIEKLFPEHLSSTTPPACRVTVCSIAGTSTEPALGDVIRVIAEPPAGVPVVHEIIGVEVESAVTAQPMTATEVRLLSAISSLHYNPSLSYHLYLPASTDPPGRPRACPSRSRCSPLRRLRLWHRGRD